MTPKQKQWTEKQITLIIDPIKRVGPLSMTDEQWEAVNNRIDHVIRLAKGNKEVREALFDAIEPYDKIKKEESTVCGLFFENKKHTL